MGSGYSNGYGGNNNGSSSPKGKHEARMHHRVQNWASRVRNRLTGAEKKYFKVACVVYDDKTKRFYYGRNGGINSPNVKKNPILFGDGKKKGILPEKSLNSYKVGSCAEIDAVNKALNHGSRIENLHILVIDARKQPKFFGNYMKSCENCTATLKGRVKENYSGWENGGKK